MNTLIKFLITIIFITIFNTGKLAAVEKIKIGLLIPLSGEHKFTGNLKVLRLKICKTVEFSPLTPKSRIIRGRMVKITHL